MGNASKSFFIQFLYFLCIAVPYLNNYELTFLIWLVTGIITIKNKYSFTILKYVAIFSAILIIAIFSGILRGNDMYLFIRDFTYMSKPVVGLLAGYQLCRYNSDKAFRLIIYTGVLLSLIHLIVVFCAFIQYHTVTVNILRASGGYFSDYEIYVVILLMFYKKFGIQLSRQRVKILLIIVGLSSFLYLARTNLIQFIILFVGMKGYLALNRKALMALSSLVITVLLSYAVILYINPKRGGVGLEAFLYKIKIAPIEPFKTKIDKDNWKDFNDNYRSYENIIAVRQVSSQGMAPVIFGEGLGSTLDLGRRVLSNDGEYVRHIPIVHNGYMTVFLKSGIAGVLFLIYFIYILSRQKRSDNYVIQNINFLITATGIFLIISNWVFLGFYLKLDNKSLLLGFLLCLRQIIEKERLLKPITNEPIEAT